MPNVLGPARLFEPLGVFPDADGLAAITEDGRNCGSASVRSVSRRDTDVDECHFGKCRG
jgi:hypothetical protein